MRAQDSATTAHLAARKPFIVRHLLTISARNRATGAPEVLGLWDGDDHADFTLDGLTVTYFGAGGLVKIGPFSHGIGTDIRKVDVVLAPMAPEVATAIRGYDPRTAPVTIHRMLIDPDTLAVIGTPVRRLKGRVSKVELTGGDGDGAEAQCKVTLATSAIEGTRGLALKKSDESQKLRLLPNGAPDRLMRYATVSGKAPVKWGE
ncbi:hypothetical protein ACEYYA_02605 [Paracoccus sp. p3-h83]|uniref:hypothetical protein n=1 Tax=Paracoccus sp. p3-h83 TaxID=3342805 RepID=UPI0035BB4804